MPTFYLKFRKDGVTRDSAEAIDLPDLETAIEEATASARELVASAVRMAREGSADSIVISDENGCELATVLFADMIPKRWRT
jgi:hypothetical protein